MLTASTPYCTGQQMDAKNALAQAVRSAITTAKPMALVQAATIARHCKHITLSEAMSETLWDQDAAILAILAAGLTGDSTACVNAARDLAYLIADKHSECVFDLDDSALTEVMA
jgi:hypothetical protein